MKERGGDECVIEVGCGLCNILSQLNKINRIGFDLSPEVIEADKLLYKDISFIVGSFDDVKNIDAAYLISVNFIHGIPSEELKKYYKNVTINNRIKHIVVDEICVNYKPNHDFSKILPMEYSLQQKLGPYPSSGGSKRYIHIYTKSECNEV